MSVNMQAAIEELLRHLSDLEQQKTDTKKTVNSLCRVSGQPAMFADDELAAATSHSLQLNGDEYFNKPLAAVVRLILLARKSRNQGPATAEEIHQAMEAGGFRFDGRGEAKALQGLKISLSKNTTTFMKLPNGKFGLAEWYGRDGRPKPRQNGGGVESTDDQDGLPEDVAEATENRQDVVLALPSKPR